MSEGKPEPQQGTRVLDAESVERYLLDNPEFFVGRESLLSRLDVPHDVDGAVSLVERQVDVLRARNTDLNRSIESYTSAAQHNAEVFEKVAKLLLALLEGDPGAGLLDEFKEYMLANFNCCGCSLIVFDDGERSVNDWIRLMPKSRCDEALGGIAAGSQPVLGMLREKDRRFLYGELGDAVQSSAIVAVRREAEVALFALGSEDPATFESGMGTVFLTLVADVLARLLARAGLGATG